jgi:hypothetical protein
MEIIARMGEIKINAHKEITISKTRFPRNLYIGKLIPGPRLPDFKFVLYRTNGKRTKIVHYKNITTSPPFCLL